MAMEIITEHIKDLINKSESTNSFDKQNELIKEIIIELEKQCSDLVPLGALPSTGKLGDSYPIDENGFSEALDPLQDEARYQQYFQKYGFVVGKGVIPPDLADESIKRIREIGLNLSDNKFDIDRPETNNTMPYDKNGAPLFSRGFFEIYHDGIWAQIRQSLRLYLHHVLIWRTPYLWTSFDRFGVKPPEHPESKALPLHIDQSPAIHSDFRTIQGILALSDCPKEIGTTVLVPGSRTDFDKALPYTKPDEQFVDFSLTGDPFIEHLQANAQQIPLRKGDILTWDSRCVHANTSNFTLDKTRYVALVAAGVAKENNQESIDARIQYFEFGIGKNIRDAYMHASIRPRYSDSDVLNKIRRPEKLTLLGECLYGFKKYADLKS